jgi:hypothetical protein
MKRNLWIIVGALIAIGFVILLALQFLDAKRCYDAGGVVVAPMMRDQGCYMPKTTDENTDNADVTK